jgi:hypothetical protein
MIGCAIHCYDRVSAAVTVVFFSFVEAMSFPIFAYISGATEMLKDCFQVMARLAQAAQAPVRVKFSKERTLTALLTSFRTLLRHSWLVGPTIDIKCL